ncbi:unnamed protein product [Timema podura]|uniref:Uncharacterized protein n=1 Tax=Timema podura TaxID=61482 RepID=A0ABN7P8J3_TIMPD|nr:unnamed protein product [Timema podura]
MTPRESILDLKWRRSKCRYTLLEQSGVELGRDEVNWGRSGKKLDTWFSVNPRTGVKHEVLSFDKVDRTCPLTDSDESILLGKTEYNILMFDSKSKERQWNITFFDYSSTAMESERVNSYG